MILYHRPGDKVSTRTEQVHGENPAVGDRADHLVDGDTVIHTEQYYGTADQNAVRVEDGGCDEETVGIVVNIVDLVILAVKLGYFLLEI